MFDLNPMDVLHQRKLRTVAPHFTELNITDHEIFEGVEDWIKAKLKGRYYICKKPTLDKSGNLRSSYVVGFEDHQESTYFMLACPHLRRN
jgi:hypothetical protein